MGSKYELPSCWAAHIECEGGTTAILRACVGAIQGPWPNFRPVADNFQRASCGVAIEYLVESRHSVRSTESPYFAFAFASAVAVAPEIGPGFSPDNTRLPNRIRGFSPRDITPIRIATRQRAEGPPHTSLGRRPRYHAPMEGRGLKARHIASPTTHKRGIDKPHPNPHDQSDIQHSATRN